MKIISKMDSHSLQLKDYLMYPYQRTSSGKLLIDLASCNYWLRRALMVKENSFGILSARWRPSSKPICADKEKVTSYILSGVALQNYSQEKRNASYCPLGF